MKEKNTVKKSNRISKRTRMEQIKSGLFLAPSFIGVMLFFVIPFGVVVYYSLLENPISKVFVGLQNFQKIVVNKAFVTAATNTFRFSIIAVPLSVVIALLLAIMLDEKIPFHTQFRTFFLSPMMVPVASIVLIWQVLFHQNGAVNDILLKFFDFKPIDWLKSDQGYIVIVVLFLWKNLGYNMILFMASLASIPKDIIEVARLESANSFQIFFKIKVRYLSSTFMFVTIMSLISSFKVFREVYLLTGDYPYGSMYMLQTYMNNTFRSLDYQKLSSAAVLMSIVMVFIIGIMFLAENAFGKDVEG